jgi:serine/threonine-protein kinase
MSSFSDPSQKRSSREVSETLVLLCIPGGKRRKINQQEKTSRIAPAGEDRRRVDRIMDNVTQTHPPSSGSLSPAELDLTGRTLADYHVLRHLGQGGMGQVYLAEQISLQRKVALKILRPELASDPTALPRFKHEATAVAQATHANIVQVYAINETDGVWYMVLEYVEGRNLREYLAKKGPPDVLLALSIMRQVASALQRAGELGIIHRDIKPENILLTRKGEVKVADFGLARFLEGDRPALNLTRSGVTMGTPLYMSPEQVEGKPVDGRTDIYSFGVTCYHMLVGQPPFQGDSPFIVAEQHVRAEPKPLVEVRPDLPPGLCAIVHKMLAKDPAQRYQTGRELLKDIGRLREGLSGQTAALTATQGVEMVPLGPDSLTEGGVVAATTPGSVAIPRRSASRWGWRILLAGASLLLAAGIGVGIGWLRHRLAFPPHAAVTPSSEEGRTALSEPSEETALRTVTEPYLNSRPTDAVETQTGMGLCVKLGVFYLERDRLDDALNLFKRLEGHKMPAFRMIGHVGRGIVLALRSQSQESNEVFRNLFVHGNDTPAKQRFAGLQVWMWRDEKWRYWMRKALHYNRQNGIKTEEIPSALHKLL